MRPDRSVAAQVGQVLSWAAVVLVAGIVTVCVLLPRVAGASPYTILTGSMRPSMPPGTLVVVKPVPAARVEVGDVITYQLESGKAAVVTHRVVEQGMDAEHHPVFRTQGDANPSPDPLWVRPAQIRGERWYSVPWVGHLGAILSGRQREVLDAGVGVLLLGYAARMFQVGARDRRRRRTTEPAQREKVLAHE